MADDLTLFGERVQRRRSDLGIQQHELAAQIGKTRSSVANIEAGRQNVGVLLMLKLASVLRTTVASLLGEEDLASLPDVSVTHSWVVRCDQCGVVGYEPEHEEARAARTAHISSAHLDPVGSPEVTDGR